MAKSKKYYARRRYRNRFYKIAHDYAYAKMTVPVRIKLSNAGAIMFWGNQSGSSHTVSTLLTSSADWPHYRSLFTNFKIKSCKIDCVLYLLQIIQVVNK